jgi:hypothetical protein
LKLKKDIGKGYKLSLKIEYNKISIVDQEQEFENLDFFPNLSRLIIPFSVAFENDNPPDIYDGNELIPFKEKDREFKDILIREFLID